MRGQERGITGTTDPPSPVDQHLAPAAEAGQKISGRLPGPDDSRRRDRLHDANMRDLVMSQERANGEVRNPWPPFDIRGSHAAHPRPRGMDGLVHQLRQQGSNAGHADRVLVRNACFTRLLMVLSGTVASYKIVGSL